MASLPPSKARPLKAMIAAAAALAAACGDSGASPDGGPHEPPAVTSPNGESGGPEEPKEDSTYMIGLLNDPGVRSWATQKLAETRADGTVPSENEVSQFIRETYDESKLRFLGYASH